MAKIRGYARIREGNQHAEIKAYHPAKAEALRPVCPTAFCADALALP